MGSEMNNFTIGTDFLATGLSNQKSMPHGETKSEMQRLVEEMRLRGKEHRRDLGILQSQMKEMMRTMQERLSQFEYRKRMGICMIER